MSFWSNVRGHVAMRIGELAGASVSPEDFSLPPKPELGDLAYGCFKLAKTMGVSPAEAAKTIAEKFPKDDRLIKGVVATGPFLNITLQTGEFIHRLIRDIEAGGEAFGMSTLGAGKTVMLEYAQPNTHKEMHVGHLRNLALGSAMANILRQASWDVIPVSYHGDVGAHVSKCLWWMVESFRTSGGRVVGAPEQKKGAKVEAKSEAMGLTMKEVDALLVAVPREERTGRYLGRLYAESTRKLEDMPEAKDVVSAVLRALEAHDPIWNKLWIETRRWSLDEMAALFDELGVKITRQYLESEVVDEGQRIVDQLIAKGVAKESQGAIVVDLEDKKLGVFLIRKSDGTSLYATKDLALAYLKEREYPKLNRGLVLVDNRQMHYFNQLFETLKLMEYPVTTEFAGYEFVTLKSGAMSSREGNIVTYQDFRDEIFAKTRKETLNRHGDWNEGKVHYAAWALAMAAVKFGMLRQDAEKIFTFDVDQALSFEGDTGPYVQYAAVRLGAILRKSGVVIPRGEDTPDCRILNEPAEKALALALARFEDVCRRAAEDLRPSQLAQWCVETAQLANAFYRDVKVLDTQEPERSARLRFVAAARDVLGRGLELLGIPVPEEM
jgi:arginyl-tRNA synthetase